MKGFIRTAVILNKLGCLLKVKMLRPECVYENGYTSTYNGIDVENFLPEWILFDTSCFQL